MIKVLVVDDSAVVRRVLSEELSGVDGIEVVGTAIDPFQAREQIVKLDPDVLTLDIEMPRMDGLSFLAKLMKHKPMPVVVVSSVTPTNSAAAVRALELGAVEVVPKPGSQFSVPDVRRTLARSIRAAARARVEKRTPLSDAAGATVTSLKGFQTTHQVIAIGASTGGTRAIESVLRSFPPDAPGTVIVQHMPAGFTSSFAKRLNDECSVRVKEATGGDGVMPGVVLIAPGDHHMLLHRSGARFSVRVRKGPPVNHHRPSVDVLFQSVAENCGANALGVILTGMGSDGAKGLREMRDAGAHTIGQDEASSVVYGMPKAAVEMGAVVESLPLTEVAEGILRSVKKQAQEPVPAVN